MLSARAAPAVDHQLPGRHARDAAGSPASDRIHEHCELEIREPCPDRLQAPEDTARHSRFVIQPMATPASEQRQERQYDQRAFR